MDRDDANMKHFKARSKNNKKSQKSSTTSQQKKVEYDGMPNVQEIDAARWCYVGTSPCVTDYNVCQARKRHQAWMADN